LNSMIYDTCIISLYLKTNLNEEHHKKIGVAQIVLGDL